MRLALVLVLLLCSSPAAAQDPIPPDSYDGADTAELVRLARLRRAVVDTRITAYDVTAHERMSARLRVAGFDRLIFRREIAAQISWTRDTVRIELLGAREAQPLFRAGADRPPPDVGGTLPALAFDPVDSEMLFRLDSTSILHPLAPGNEANYRFSRGDVTSIRLADGRVVRLLELRIAARRADQRLINGSFWLDAETHAVVRAAFRLSRAITASESGSTVGVPELSAELSHVLIDYGLWDLRWWLPRSVVAQGEVRISGTRLPLAYERSYEGYRVAGDTTGPAVPLDALTDAVAERPCRRQTSGSVTIHTGSNSEARDSAWNAGWERTVERLARPDTSSSSACDRVFLVTRAEDVDLITSPIFEGDVYDESVGPVTEAEMRELERLLGSIPDIPWGRPRTTHHLLTPDLIRFNRVEGLSLGGAAVLDFGPARLRGELRAGTTGEVGLRLSGRRALRSMTVEAAGYRGLEAVDVASQPFSLAASARALVLGRDENDYFRGTGAELRLSPPAALPRSWELRLFAERQEAVRARTDASLRTLIRDGTDVRPNIAADPLDQLGATLRLRAARGDDPARLRTRGELELHGEAGERAFARPLLRLTAERPIAAGFGFGLGVAAGAGLGDVPAQRAWQIGGATTVRGHDAAALRGEHLWLARAELNRGTPGFRLAVFGDAGWAGEGADLWSAKPLRGVGVGVTVLDDLLRLDLARGLGGGGLRLHVRMGGSL